MRFMRSPPPVPRRRLGPAALALALAAWAGCSDSPLVTVPDAPPAGVAVCHTQGDGAFVYAVQDSSAVPDHLGHGDGIPTGPVPGLAGFVFTAECTVEADTDAGPCPAGMAHIEDTCVDRWEAHLEDRSPYEVPTAGVARTAPGVVPQGYISGDVAAAACQAAGKRLCTSTEWLRACRGPEARVYPYGSGYRPSACNEGRSDHPVVELFGDSADWSMRQMNDPRLNQLPNSVDPAGANPVCQSAEGVYDLHGNLHEWVADPEGTFRGGFYVDAEINGAGCLYRTTAHGRSYHDYSTGFRCCADAR